MNTTGAHQDQALGGSLMITAIFLALYILIALAIGKEKP